MTIKSIPKESRPPLWATETRMQAIIHNWFEEQCGGAPPSETLARRIINSFPIMPDEFFEHVKNFDKDK